MTLLTVTIGSDTFQGRLRDDRAPGTCRFFRSLLPFAARIIHVRWSGEGLWVPLGNLATGVGYENATSHPAPGEFILYPGGVSETEILLAYGGVQFASKAGQLAGNPFLTIADGLERLAEIGRETLWEGSKAVLFDRVPA